MDMLGIKMKPIAKKQSRKSKKGIKVVYISTPLKVEICASEFRSIVQELTGKDSDSSNFMDTLHHDHDNRAPVDFHRKEYGLAGVPSSSASPNSSYSYESSSPANSDSVFEFDKYLAPMDGSFMSMFQPNFLYDSSDQLDFLN